MTGGPPVRGGGGMPQRIMASSVPVSAKGARWTSARRARRSQVVAVKGKDVESVELDLVIVLPAVEPVEVRDAVYAKQHGFAIEERTGLFGCDVLLRQSTGSGLSSHSHCG
jgi:hypothetical protein